MSLGFNGTISLSEAYARRALDSECDLASSISAGRNDQLNRSAFNIGQFVGAGLVDRNEAEDRLISCANASGYVAKDGLPAARATIKSGLDKGMRQPRQVPTGGQAYTPIPVMQEPRQAPKLSGVAIPEWTPPNAEGKPKLFGIGKDEPPRFDGDVRRHTYWRDGSPVRVKVKKAGTPPWVDSYRVRRPSDGAIGWQAKKPEGYVPVPYIGPPGSADPFRPERRGEILTWAEGEKDVDTLQKKGFLSFTFGSASDVPDCGELLAGHHLIIVVDNDEAGERSIAKKAAAAIGFAANVKVVRFPELQEGGDVSDFFEGGGDAEGFLDRARAHIEPPPDAGADGSSITWYGDVEPVPPPFLIKGLLPQGQTAILAGQFSSGKTFIGIDLSFSVMTGRPFNGHDVERSGAVLWLAAEGKTEVSIRLKAAAIQHTGDDMKGQLPFAHQTFAVPTLTSSDALPKLMQLVADTKAGLAKRFPDVELVLIVIDTLNSAAGFQDENHSSETQKVFTNLRALSDASGALVLVIDHHGKSTETGVRGSSAKSDAADAILSALADKNPDGEISNRRLVVSKFRAGATGKVSPFSLIPVQIDAWGNTTCAVGWEEPLTEAIIMKPPKPLWSGKSRLLKDSMTTAMIEHGRTIRPFGFEGPEVKAVDREKVRVEFYASYTADGDADAKQDTKKRTFTRLIEDCVGKHLITGREHQGVGMLWFVHEGQP